MAAHLMLVSIGPVQDFIAAARKIRDLWFGSSLLSELSKRAAITLQTQGAALIFPYIPAQGADAATHAELKASNKILAIVQGAAPAPIFEAVKQDVQDYWQGRANRLLPDRVKENCDKGLFEEQIQDALEVYGAWTPLGADYLASWREVEALLAARKTLRQFAPCPVRTGGAPPKSSLDGRFESVLNGTLREKEKGKLHLKEFEELDAVGLVKRHGDDGTESKRPRFDTLSDLAADPWLRGVLHHAQGPELLRLLTARIVACDIAPRIPSVANRPDGHPLANYGAQVLFPSRTLAILEEVHPDASPETYRLPLERLYGELHALAGSEPCPYAAVIVGDGDRMGETLGRVLHNASGHEAHQKISSALAGFARKANEILRANAGSLIYSGGDDVLAFCPLDTLLACLKELRSSFTEILGKVIAAPDTPGFSVGVAIVHHLRPMGASLASARAAERLAKGPRNALAMTLEKRSGPPLSLCGQWDHGLLERLGYWTRLHCADVLPDKLGYQLRRLATELGDVLCWKDGNPDNAAAFEMLRVLSRKQSEHGKVAVPEDVMGAVKEHACRCDSLRRFADELILARLLAQATNQATFAKEGR